MLKLLTNITDITIQADENSFVSLLYQFFKFTITNTSVPYAICGFIIVMCMFATTLRNLIYKVLNLAVLSVFVVALWAYQTDVTFIYVVYILTFVSAVVMLFLSVVLMLPSSAIAVTKRNFLFVLLTSTASTTETSVVSTIASIATDIVYFCLALVAVYLVVAFFKSWRARSTYKRYGHPDIHVVLTTEPMSKHIGAPRYASKGGVGAKRFAETHYFYIYDKPKINDLAVYNCINSSSEHAEFGTIHQYLRGDPCYLAEYGHKPIRNRNTRFDLNVLGIRYGSSSSEMAMCKLIPDFEIVDMFYPKYIRAVPRLVGPINAHYTDHTRRAILMVGYEFINFYVHRLEPRLFRNSESYMAATARLRKFAKATKDHMEYHCYIGGSRHPIVFNINDEALKPVFVSIYTPWWSPFRVFGSKFTGKPMVDRAIDYLIKRLEDYFYNKRSGISKVVDTMPPALNSFIPPIIVEVISRCIVIFFNYTFKTFRYILTNFKLHPALTFKLTDHPAAISTIIYTANAVYSGVINLIFSNVELPLSSKTGGKSGLPMFAGFYDLVVPVYSPVDAPAMGYSVRPTQYIINKVQTNNLIFIKNFIIFMLANLVFNLSNTIVRIVIFLTLPANIELIVQTITTVSVFFIAFPTGLAGGWALFTYGHYLVNRDTSNFAENLTAIQQGLYISEPLLLLVSITGLLVALIGAPFFIAKSN